MSFNCLEDNHAVICAILLWYSSYYYDMYHTRKYSLRTKQIRDTITEKCTRTLNIYCKFNENNLKDSLIVWLETYDILEKKKQESKILVLAAFLGVLQGIDKYIDIMVDLMTVKLRYFV